MQEREQATGPAGKPVNRAARIDLEDFAEALSSGVLRAIEARRANPAVGRPHQVNWRPWIWAGWIIGDEGPFGPFGPGEGPLGPGGPGR